MQRTAPLARAIAPAPGPRRSRRSNQELNRAQTRERRTGNRQAWGGPRQIQRSAQLSNGLRSAIPSCLPKDIVTGPPRCITRTCYPRQPHRREICGGPSGGSTAPPPRRPQCTPPAAVQNRIFRQSCVLYGSPEPIPGAPYSMPMVDVLHPNEDPSPRALSGCARFVRLNTLYISTRN